MKLLLMMQNINIAMPMYNLIEYSDSYSDTSGSLWQFKRNEIKGNDLTADAYHIPNKSPSFKHKSSFIANRNDVKIVVWLKYLSNFWRSLEMPLINCKVELSLTWNPNCVQSNFVGNSTFTITGAKLYLPVVFLSKEDNTKLPKLLTEGFKRPVYWSKYKIIPNKTYDQNDNTRELLDSSYQGVKYYLFLLIEIKVVLMELQLILIGDIFSPELKEKITTSKLMEEIFMINQLMTQLSNIGSHW